MQGIKPAAKAIPRLSIDDRSWSEQFGCDVPPCLLAKTERGAMSVRKELRLAFEMVEVNAAIAHHDVNRSRFA